MNTSSHVPPGFRFHPTDEELVDYYLRKKVASRKIDLDVIKDVDLYKIEPWDLQDKCSTGAEEQNEWYFFSHKDKKYPTGTRTNRATTAGFWKATGRDKPIYARNSLIGMRKTLVFYKGRAPNGQKSDWIMHEYRLETNEAVTPQEEGWVVCRAFKKRVAPVRRASEHEASFWYEDDQVSFFPDLHSPRRMGSSQQVDVAYQQHIYAFKQEMDHLHYRLPNEPGSFLQLPQLESPTLPSYVSQGDHLLQNVPSLAQEEQTQSGQQQQQMFSLYTGSSSSGGNNNTVEQAAAGQLATDWRVLDKFVASQLSQADVSEDPPNPDSIFLVSGKEEQQPVAGYASASSPTTCQIDLIMWK